MNFAVNVVVLNRTCLMTSKLNCLKLLGGKNCNIFKLPKFHGSFHKTEDHQRCPPSKKAELECDKIFLVCIAMTFLFNSRCCFFFGRII